MILLICLTIFLLNQFSFYFSLFYLRHSIIMLDARPSRMALQFATKGMYSSVEHHDLIVELTTFDVCIYICGNYKQCQIMSSKNWHIPFLHVVVSLLDMSLNKGLVLVLGCKQCLVSHDIFTEMFHRIYFVCNARKFLFVLLLCNLQNILIIEGFKFNFKYAMHNHLQLTIYVPWSTYQAPTLQIYNYPFCFRQWSFTLINKQHTNIQDK